MYQKLLRVVIAKAINNKDKAFMKTPVFKAICEYTGVPNDCVDTITVYEYSLRSGRDYSVCKRIASGYALGVKIGGKRMLSPDECKFIDERHK